MTAIELITRAMRECAALSIAEVPSAEEAAVGLENLNAFVGALQIQRLAIWVRERAVYDLVADQGGPDNPYTIGDGGDFDRHRPADIATASIISNNNPTQPVELGIDILNYQEWQGVTSKEVTSQLPQYLYYERSMPLGKIYLYPIPTDSTVDLVLYLPTPMTEFADLVTDYDLPPGYADMLSYGLAVRFASLYRLPRDPQLEQLAKDAMAVVKRTNIEELLMTTDPELNQRPAGIYNWLSDSFGPGAPR